MLIMELLPAIEFKAVVVICIVLFIDVCYPLFEDMMLPPFL